MKRIYYISAVLILFIINLFLFAVDKRIRGGVFLTKAVYTADYNYNKSEKPSKIKIDTKNYPDASKYFKISYKFKVNDYSEYGNIFQTDDLDTGIRFEINHQTREGALLYPDINGYLTAIPIGIVNPDIWYNVKICAANNNITITVDDINYKARLNIGNFSINKMLVGQGYSSERIFKGKIKNFKILYCDTKLSPGLANFIHNIKNMFWGLFVFLIVVPIFIMTKDKILYLFKLLFNKVKHFNLKNYIYTSVILVIIATLLLNICQYKTIYHNNFYVKQYDSTSKNRNISQPVTKIFEEKKGNIKKVEISFDFKIDKINNYDNIFQTSDYNNGIRMEINKSLEGAFIIYDPRPPYLIGISAGVLNPGQWYSARMVTKEDGYFDCYIDKKLVGSKKISNKFLLDKIVVGQGYDETRTFNGQIKNFKLKYSLLDKISKNEKIMLFSAFYIIFAVMLLLTITYIIRNPLPQSEKIDKKDLMYLILLNIYPILYLYLHNISELLFIEFVYISIISSLIVVVLYCLLYRIIERNKLFMFLSLSILLFYMAGHCYNLLSVHLLVNNEIYMYNLIALYSIVSVVLITSRKNIGVLMQPAKAVIALLISMCIFFNIPLIYTHIKVVVNNIKNRQIEKIKTIENHEIKKPDIYFIILDGYINAESAKKQYKYDNSDFINKMQEKGFYIAKYSISNYGHTIFSVPSMLNYDYLQNLGISVGTKYTSDKFHKLYVNNSLVADYVVQQYNIYFVNLENVVATAPFANKYLYKKYDANLNAEYSLKNMILQNSIFFVNQNNFGLLHRNNILRSFEYLENIVKDKKDNKFIFSHLLCPHPPYIFSKDGNFPAYKKRLEYNKKKYYTPNYPGYFEQLEYINSRVLNLVEKIISNNKNSVIIFISDHGYLPNKKYPKNHHGSFMYNDDDYYTRAGNFEAIYFPDGDYSMLYPEISPVNLVRVLLNKYFDADLKMLEDKHYYSKDYLNFAPVDVTDNVNKYLK